MQGEAEEEEEISPSNGGKADCDMPEIKPLEKKIDPLNLPLSVLPFV